MTVLTTKKIFISALLLTIATTAIGQNIISLDAGVLSSTPNVASGGFDFVNNDNDPDDQTSNQHGHVVASVMASVYSGSSIIPVKIVGPGFSSSSGYTNSGLNFAALQGARVVAKSTGAGGSLASWKNVVGAGKVAVVPAGNQGHSTPAKDGSYANSLGGRMIVVGAVDSNNDIASYSNRAGDVANYYVTTPGFNEFSTSKGTSFATPRVAAVAANILSQNPNLSAEQVVDIILSSADDLGAPGVDSVYGRGLLNPGRATSPELTGGGSSSSGSSGAVIVVALAAAGAITYAILKNRKKGSLEKTLIIDSYDRGFIFDLPEMISSKELGPDINDLMSFSSLRSEMIPLGNNDKSTSYAQATTRFGETVSLYKWYDESLLFEDKQLVSSLSFYHQTYDGAYYQLNYNGSGITGLGAFALLDDEGISSPEFRYVKSFSSPYMGFTDQGYSSLMKFPLDNYFAFHFGLSNNQDNKLFGLESDSAIIEGTYQRDKYALGVRLGSLHESGSLFGGASGGALSVDESKTISIGLSAMYKVSDRLKVIGNYNEGYTSVDDWEESFLRNFSGLRSNAYGVGFIGNDVFQENDRLGLGYSRPLKVIDGSVDLRVPEGREDFGEPVYYSEERISLTPSADEQAIEFYYSFDLTDKAELTTYYLHREHPDHNVDADNENLIYATLKFKN